MFADAADTKQCPHTICVAITCLAVSTGTGWVQACGSVGDRLADFSVCTILRPEFTGDRGTCILADSDAPFLWIEVCDRITFFGASMGASGVCRRIARFLTATVDAEHSRCAGVGEFADFSSFGSSRIDTRDSTGDQVAAFARRTIILFVEVTEGWSFRRLAIARFVFFADDFHFARADVATTGVVTSGAAKRGTDDLANETRHTDVA